MQVRTPVVEWDSRGRGGRRKARYNRSHVGSRGGKQEKPVDVEEGRTFRWRGSNGLGRCRVVLGVVLWSYWSKLMLLAYQSLAFGPPCQGGVTAWHESFIPSGIDNVSKSDGAKAGGLSPDRPERTAAGQILPFRVNIDSTGFGCWNYNRKCRVYMFTP
jgi:hypothetical protein